MAQPKEYRILENEVWLPYRIAYCQTWTRFFEDERKRSSMEQSALNADEF